MKYEVFSKEDDMMEFVDQKEYGKDAFRVHTYFKYFHRWHYRVYE
jgi:hypothetical protein